METQEEIWDLSMEKKLLSKSFTLQKTRSNVKIKKRNF